MTSTGILNFLLHFDRYISLVVQQYGPLTYLFLFLIMFCETGLVITPFLPGDSLLFIAGTFAANGSLNIIILFVVFVLAAIIGDSVNYWIGSHFGKRVLTKTTLVKTEYLERTERFYEKHGKKTIIIARFIPIIRTFAPFIAGIGKMRYRTFFIYNVIGALVWVIIFLLAGYYFGSIPFIKNNLALILYAIIIATLIPPILQYILNRIKIRKENSLKNK